MSMFQTQQHAQPAPQHAQPIGGGGLFAGVAGAKRFGTGKNFMSPGTAWCLIRRCYEGTNQKQEKNANIDMTVIAVVDPAIAEILPPETPNRIGKDVAYTTVNKPGPQNYFLSNISAIVKTMTGEDLETATPARATEVCDAIFKHAALENHVAEVRSYVKYVRGNTSPSGRRVYQTFVRRVPWQEVAMLLSPAQQQTFFGGKLDQLAQAEAQNFQVPGWKPGIAGPGSDTTQAAIVAAAGLQNAAAALQPAPMASVAAPAASAPYTPPVGAQPPQFGQPAPVAAPVAGGMFFGR